MTEVQPDDVFRIETQRGIGKSRRWVKARVGEKVISDHTKFVQKTAEYFAEIGDTSVLRWRPTLQSLKPLCQVRHLELP